MIDFTKYWTLTLHFLANNTLITLGIILVLLIFFYKKTIETIKFLGICALIITVLYIMSLLSESGSSGALIKKDLGTKSERGMD